MLIAMLISAVCSASLPPHRRAPQANPQRVNKATRVLFDAQKAIVEQKRKKSERSLLRPLTLFAPAVALQPRLEPHDIDVITLDGRITKDALQKLLTHKACAVHVRGFLMPSDCKQIEAALSGNGEFSPWDINRKGSAGVRSEVEKLGVVSGEALDSLSAFESYLSAASRLDKLLPGRLNPFERLRQQLDEAYPKGCRGDKVARGFPMPLGTFRRMNRSKGLVHADTASLLSCTEGEFSANIYVRTPTGKGALNIYPAQQYTAAEIPQLNALFEAQKGAFSSASQELLRRALPLRRTIEMEDGDVILINTGRFHEVQAYEEGHRLSGQCWLSFREGYPLYMWV